MNIEQRIAALEAEIEKLKGTVNVTFICPDLVEQPGPLKVAFEKAKAKCGGSYWYINENSGAAYAENYSEEYAFSDFCKGNFFVSLEAGVKAKRNREVHVFLRALAEGFEPDWDDGWQSKWVYGKMTFTGGGYMWQAATVHLPNTVYFREPIENIQQLVDARFGEGALAQYLKGDVI